MEDALTDTSDHELVHQATTMGRHDDQVSAAPLRLVEDSFNRFSLDEEGRCLGTCVSEYLRQAG